MARVLILHASVGTGHRRAAEALAAAWRRDPTVEAAVVDVLDHTSRLFRIAYTRSYLELSENAPLVWGSFYTLTNRDPSLAELSNNLRKLVESVNTNGLQDVVRQSQPDVIICTHFLPMELLVGLRRSNRLTQPIYCVITDYSAHTFWTYTEIDGYFVGNDTVLRQLRARGVRDEQITVSGIPIDPAFSVPLSRAEARRRRNLMLDDAVVTLFGGGIDDEIVAAIGSDLLERLPTLQLVVIAGRNETLPARMAGLAQAAGSRLRVLGRIDYVDDMLVASDLVITKAGGLIVSEALARGVPLVVIEPIPGHEEWNADHVVASGSGIQLRNAGATAAAVSELLSRPQLLAEFAGGARAAGRPQAAVTITEIIRGRLPQRGKTA
jgi:processive 1,2-diacylglycerol beta-glucosyltransferase